MIIYSHSGEGNATIALPQYANKLNMINDGAAALVVTAGGIAITIRGLEQFNGGFVPFNSVAVTASGLWRFVAEDDGTVPGYESSHTTIADILWRVRERITDTDLNGVDTDFTNTELVGYLNDAIDWLSLQLIQAKNPEMVKEMMVTEGCIVPINFDSFCGLFPVALTGNRFNILDGSPSVAIRYFAVKNHVKYVASSEHYEPMYSPFKPAYDTLLIQRTAILALNRNADDVSQDEKILAQQTAGGVVNA